MTIYERIKNRRKELGLSAEAVADALGVSRATIYRYESSEIEKLPTSTLEPLAKILRTTPAYLMGWVEEKEPVEDIDTILSHIDQSKPHRAILMGSGGDGGQIVKELSQEQFEKVMKILELIDQEEK